MGLIRFLLASIVVLSHTSSIFGYKALPSDFAVQAFFVLSGFYMSLVLNKKYLNKPYSLFYKNRALKIYPVYLLILILLVFLALLVNHLGYPSTLMFYKSAKPSTWSMIFFILVNIFIVGLDLTFFLGIDNGNLYFTKHPTTSKPLVYLFGFNMIGWTVGVELLFYLIAPFILRKKVPILIIVLFVSLAVRILLANNGMGGFPWNYMFFPTQIMYFMAGAIAYRIYVFIKNNELWIKTLKLQYIALVIMIVFYSYFFGRSYFEQAGLYLILTLLTPAGFELSKNSNIDKYLGQLSYPIYISQMLVINITRANMFPKIINVGFTTLVVTVFTSVLLYHFVTKPVERMRQRPFKPATRTRLIS